MTWRTTTLGELCDEGGGSIQTGPFGSQLHAADYVAHGIPSVMPQNIGDNVIDPDGIARIADADAMRLAKYLLASGDIVYSRRGDVERRAFVRPENDGWLCGTGCLRVRLGPGSSHDSLFLSYYLGTEDARAWIVRHAVGATMANLNTGILAAVPVRVPEPHVQTAIAEVLGALDDKIAANAKLVAAADSLSALHFDRMLTLPDSRPLSSLAKFVNGKAFTKDATGTGRVVIRIAELNSGLGGSTVYNDIEVPDDHLARPGDLLFAWSGSLTVHRWYRTEGIVNQHIFKVIPTDVPLWVVKGALDRKLAEFKGIAADKATTMGHIQRRHLDEPVQVPTREEIARNDLSMTALWERSLSAEQESLHLGTLRDALLPQLMSGMIKVKDAERGVEGVV
jgi:type I restriction enzyme S subunit